MARKPVGRSHRRLVGEARKKNLCRLGIGGPFRQFEACAPGAGNRLAHVAELESRAPPPRRSRRSRLLRNCAPTGEFEHGALELHIRCLMHQTLETFCRAKGDRTLEAASVIWLRG